MLHEKSRITDDETELRNEGWQIADRAIAGVRLIMEREHALYFMPNPKGPGTLIRFEDRRTRLITPSEFKCAAKEAVHMKDPATSEDCK